MALLIPSLYVWHVQALLDPDSELVELLKAGSIDLAGKRVPLTFIGDSGYQGLEYLLIPFTQPESDADREKRNFNWRHALTRGAIERAFGRLKQRWRVLLSAMNLELESITYVILACLVLHNICEVFGMDAPDDDEYQRLLRQYNASYPVVQPLSEAEIQANMAADAAAAAAAGSSTRRRQAPAPVPAWAKVRAAFVSSLSAA